MDEVQLMHIVHYFRLVNITLCSYYRDHIRDRTVKASKAHEGKVVADEVHAHWLNVKPDDVYNP